jgi:uncharacterized membrane protein YraQ (UPF0718 family)/copper chaperone CopZ
MFETFFRNLWQVFLDLSPSLLLGLLIAGVLHVYVPKGWVRKGMSRPDWRSAMRASLIGVPMPLCSCGVVPAAIALKNEGASKGASTAFLISTPQTGVDSLLVSASFLGWPFAVFKLAAAFVTGLIGGVLVNRFSKPAPPPLPVATASESSAAVSRPREVIRYALFELFAAIDVWIFAGVVAAALITTWVPANYFSDQAWATGIVGMLLVLSISLPLYVCTTGSVPIAASMIAAGMPIGSALVFLMAGPATNLATVGAVYRALGGRVLGIYLATVIVMSIGFGLGFDFVLGDIQPVRQMHPHGADPVALASTLLVIGLMLYLTARRLRLRLASRAAVAHSRTQDLWLAVEGMTCQHCVAQVKQTLEDCAAVQEASPDLSTGQVRVRGEHLDASVLVAAVEKVGFKARLDA